MLESCDATAISVERWRALPSRAALPCRWEEYAAPVEETPCMVGSKRRYNRFRLRGIAILVDGDDCHAVYTKDASRMGIGFYSPIHLLPRKVVRLILPQKGIFRLRIARCRRLGDGCFECGTLYDLGGSNNNK